MINLNIAEVIGSPSALEQDQGDLVYNEIISAFQDQNEILLDFSDVESIISPFLNHAIGRLYETYDSDFIRNYLHMKNFPKEKNSTLNVVINNAKRFYANKTQYEQIVKEVIDNT